MDNLMLWHVLSRTIHFGVKMRNREAEDGAAGVDVPAVSEILREMRRQARGVDLASKIEGMRRYGIQPRQMIGLSVPQLRAMARTIIRKGGPDQILAEALWGTGIHDARVL